jgi:hypothetical protein
MYKKKKVGQSIVLDLGIPSHSLHVLWFCALLAWTTLDIEQRFAIGI